MPIHQFLKMSSHSLNNFAVNRDHVTTVTSQVEILSSFARDLCSTAQQFVYTSESSIQRSEQSVFIVSLELPSSTLPNPFTTGSPTESSLLLLLDQSSTEMCSLQLLWIFLCFLYSCLCLRMRAHSWTITCSVCLCHTIACLCFCVHCSLVENVLHRTKNTIHGI